MKKISWLVSILIAVSGGLVSAQNVTPVTGMPASVSAKEAEHPRIHEVVTRVKNQRSRIDNGLRSKTLTEDQAKACMDVLKSAITQMKADYKTNGSKMLTEYQMEMLNKLLDVNSSTLHEEKQASSQATTVATPGGSM
jgi:hypothetical protein